MRVVTRIISIVTIVVLLAAAVQAYSEPVMYGEDQLRALLDNIDGDIVPGTAGCSLRATARAAELMRWGMNTKMTENEIVNVVRETMEKISDERRADFSEAVDEVYGTYCILLTGENIDLLEDAGLDPSEYDFSDVEAVEAVEIIFNTIKNFEK